MKLTVEQKQFVIDKLDALPRSCECCGGDICNLNDTLFQVNSAFLPGARSLENTRGGKPSALIVLVVLTCDSCGNTKFLNAVSLGLVENETGKMLV